MKQHAVNIDDVVTYVILAFVFLWCVLAQGYGRKMFRTARQFRRDYAAGLAGGGRDKLDALIEATSERERRGWPALPAEDPWAFWEDDVAGGSGL